MAVQISNPLRRGTAWLEDKRGKETYFSSFPSFQPVKKYWNIHYKSLLLPKLLYWLSLYSISFTFFHGLLSCLKSSISLKTDKIEIWKSPFHQTLGSLLAAALCPQPSFFTEYSLSCSSPCLSLLPQPHYNLIFPEPSFPSVANSLC